MRLARVTLESDMQAEIVVVLRKLARKDERWTLVYAVPNDGMVSRNQRLRAYRMGMLVGVSDINVDLPSADGRYGYLRVELKTEKGVQSADQAEFARLVGTYGGGRYCLCRSVPEFFAQLSEHLGLDACDFLPKIEALRPKRRKSSQKASSSFYL